MAGRPPDDLAKQFAQDTLTLTTHELAHEYGIAESTVRDWRLFCKRSLDLEVGYGVPKMHFLDKKEDPGPMDDEDVWALMARMSAQRDMERKAQDHLTVVLDEPVLPAPGAQAQVAGGPGNLPYGVALTGDWHIGMEGVLYDEMDADFTALAGLPGLLALGMGDYAHNPKAKTPHRSLLRSRYGGSPPVPGSRASVLSTELSFFDPLVCRVYRHFDIERMVAILRSTDALKALMALEKGAQAQ